MHLECLALPDDEPVTREELIAQSRIDETGEQALLDRLIATARSHVESYTGRSIMRQDWRMTLDSFPAGGVIRLPKGPVSEVLTVSYLAKDGAQVALASSAWRLIGAGGLMPQLVPAVGHVWPKAACAAGVVEITFRCGVTDRTKVPQSLRHAVLMLAAHWFEHREAVAEVSSGSGLLPMPMAVESLMAPYVVPWVA